MFNLTLSPHISNIFEGFCILKRDENVKCLYAFPADYSFQRFYEFIFPCNCPKDKSEEYCIVTSNAYNDRSFLICRYCDVYESTLCIYSHNPWYEIFRKLLFNLCHSDFMPEKYSTIESYLQQNYQMYDGSQIILPPCTANDKTPQHILRPTMKYPYIYDKYIQEYFTAIKPFSGYNKQLWLEVFWSMLLERPIIFMSKRYQKLTSCLLAATFFIHPLSWLHKFIGIIPQKNPQLLGMNCCMLGIHNCMEPILDKTDFWNEALLVDLDRGESKMVGTSENPKETESRFKIPKYIKKFFISHVQMVDDSLSSQAPHRIKDLISNTPWNINEEEIMYNEYKKGFHIYPLLFRTIISLIIGNYRQFIIVRENCYKFEKEKFIQSNPKLTDFLRIFVQSQCFDSFIEEKLRCFHDGQDMNDRFDRERQEVTFKNKLSNSKIKMKKPFRKNSSFTGNTLKIDNKSDRIEKISSMPYPKKPRKKTEKDFKTVFHTKSLSLSSSLSSINGNYNVNRDNCTDNSSTNSESLEDQILKELVEIRMSLDKDRNSRLSTISSHTATDQDDLLVTPTYDKFMIHGSKLVSNNPSLSKSLNQLAIIKSTRPIFKQGENPSGRVHSIIQQINHGKIDLNNENTIRKKSISQIKQSELPSNHKPVSQIASIFEQKSK